MEPCQQEGPPSGAEEGGAGGGDGRGEAGEISEDGGGVGGPQARGRSAGVAGAEEVDELSPPLRFLSLDEEAIKVRMRRNIQSVVRRKQEHKKEDEELEELNKQIGSILGGEDLGGECAQDAPAAPPACASDGQGPCLQASSTPVEGENGTNGGSHEVPPCEETDLTGGNDVPDADQSSESCGADAPCPLAGAQGPPDSELESTENGLETEEPVGVGGSAGQRAAYASEEPGLTPGGKAPGGGTRGYQASGLPIDQVMDLMESLRLPIGYGKTKRPGHPKGSIGGNQRQQGSKSSCRPASAPVSSKGSKAKRLIRELERKPKLRDLEGANPGASDARRAAVAEGTRSGRFSGSGSNGELVSQSALEGAGVAVDRNSSGLLDEQEFIRLMHMEQSLEEELLGIDRTLTAKLSMTRLAAGTMAVTAAEAAAAGSPSQVHGANGTPGSSLHSVQGSAPRKPSGLSETQRTQGREPPEWLGYAARSKVARARNPPDVPFENPPQGHVSAAEVLYPPPPSEHCPSHAGHVMDCLQGWSSPRTRTAPRNWSTVYDRTYAWKKRAENKCVLEKKRKDDDSLKECTFSPNINRKGSPKAECESMSVGLCRCFSLW
ncbi:unnamed protein product [Ostreobium quekettii]|uniref:EF-hand domain-containing protein n=1 Tax=Ostreobium quekettii TaxID=121088 RepID=A0A8S1IKU4_9CHLO|nr:unnamed protein product [Ostreobium quekettii]